ncbi:T9SS type A sorting domain-containing protein [Wenyingzhuangia sp. IMCC45467]
MRKKLLLALLLTVGMMGAFAQTTTTVEPTEGSTVEAPLGNDVRFKFQSSLIVVGTFKLECTSVPALATNNFTQEVTVVNISGLNLAEVFNSINPTVAGDYVFTLKKKAAIGSSYSNLIDSFTLQMTEETLSNNNVENSPEFSATCNAGILTITNASEATGVSILSVSGATVYTSNKAVDIIDVSSLASGMYVLVVEEGGVRITRKFIKN